MNGARADGVVRMLLAFGVICTRVRVPLLPMLPSVLSKP